MKKLLTKTDLCIFGCALLLALAAALLFRTPTQKAVDTVNIYVDGALYASVPLGEAQRVEVLHDGMSNTVEVDAEGAWMADADCPNQDCVKQGKLTPENIGTRALGNRILCLPNRVTVELAEGTP